MKPQVVLAVLALGCSKAESDVETNSQNGTSSSRERTRVCYCNECDTPVTHTLEPSEDAVPFCEELAKIQHAAIETVIRQETATRSIKFEQPVNEYYHKAGTATCEYSELFDRMTGAQRIRVASVFVEEADVGNPDQDYHRYGDDHMQDSTGKPLKDVEGKERLGADGILDRNFGGGLGVGCDWGPTDRTFDLTQRDYSERMKFLRNQLRAGQLLPSARARNNR